MDKGVLLCGIVLISRRKTHRNNGFFFCARSSALTFDHFVNHWPSRTSTSGCVEVRMYCLPHGPSVFATASAELKPDSTRRLAHLKTSLSHGSAMMEPSSLRRKQMAAVRKKQRCCQSVEHIGQKKQNEGGRRGEGTPVCRDATKTMRLRGRLKRDTYLAASA